MRGPEMRESHADAQVIFAGFLPQPFHKSAGQAVYCPVGQIDRLALDALAADTAYITSVLKFL